MIHCRGLLAGRYRMVATNAKTGKQRLLADWFPNLITDYGLNALGAQSWNNLNFCCVGSGNDAPTNADTALASFVAASNTNNGSTTGVQNSEPYYGWRRRVIRFGEGVAAGNLSEVGMTANLTTASLFSRALILDGLGDPTTITVLSNEFLDVTYELRLYPPLTDVVEEISDGATNYTVTTRAAEVTSNGWASGTLGTRVDALTGTSSWVVARSGPIGTITGTPSGSGSNRSSITNDTYQNNSLERTGLVYFGLGAGNFGTGIKSLWWRNTAFGSFQTEFDPVIPKIDTQDLTIGVKVSWGRYVP